MFRFAATIGLVSILLVSVEPARAQTQGVATVAGRILNSDGARILYAPTDTPNQLRIREANGTETIINLGAGFTPTYGFLSPTGATFAADVSGAISGAVFNFNGAGLSRVGSLNGASSLRVEGRYAVFSGQSGVAHAAIPPSVFRLDTTTGSLVQAPGRNGNIYLDVTSGGLIAYWTQRGYDGAGDPDVDYDIEIFDGVTIRRITHSVGAIFNTYPRTDGTYFLFLRETVCCSSPYSRLFLTDGVNEILLRDGAERPIPDTDYQISGGWVAFRASDRTLWLRSPSGQLTNLGIGGSILGLSEFGEIAYIAPSGRTVLRTADGEVWEIGAYGTAFNVGRDWYFYRAGELVRFADGLMVRLNADFAGGASPFIARDGSTLFGVTDIVVPRAIVLEGGTTLDTRGYDIQMTGPISGVGGLIVTGGGLLTLRGENSFTGGLAVSADGRLMGDTRSLNGFIANGGELIFDQDFDGAFAGHLSGSGLMRKTGTGVLHIGGSQAFAGVTRIEEGGVHLVDIDTASRFVVSGGRLTGRGRIGALDVQDGLVSPGPGVATLNIAGALTLGQRSRYAVELAPDGSSDRLAAAGPILLAGGALDLYFAPVRYRIGTTWRILQGGPVTGAFGDVEVSGQLGLLDAELRYNSTSVDVALVLDEERFFTLAATPNQRTTAGALAGFPDSSDLLNEVVWLPEPQIPAALDQLSGELHATSLAALLESGRAGRTAVLRRLQHPQPDRRVWATTSLHRARYDGVDGLAESRVDSQDSMAGMDVDLSPSVRLGATVGFGDFELKPAGRGSLSDTRLGVMAYGQVGVGPVRVRGGAGVTWHDLDSRRQVAFGAVAQTLRSESTGRSEELFAEAALPLAVADIRLEPFIGVSNKTLRLSRLQEVGGEAALSSEPERLARTVSVAGMRAYGAGEVGGRQMFVRGELAWEHALDAGSHERQLSFAPTPTAFYTIEGLRAAGDSAVLGLGVGVENGPWRFEVSYDGILARDQDTHSGSATVSVAF